MTRVILSCFIFFMSQTIFAQELLIIQSKIDSLELKKSSYEKSIKQMILEISELKKIREKINRNNQLDNGIVLFTVKNTFLLDGPHSYDDKIVTIPSLTKLLAHKIVGLNYMVEYGEYIGYVMCDDVETLEQRSKRIEREKKEISQPAETKDIPNDETKLNLKIFASLYKYPSKYSLEIPKFSKENADVIGYANQMFKIKTSDGLIGYCPDNLMGYPTSVNLAKIFDKRSLVEATEENKKIYIRGASIYEINSADGVSFSIDWGYLDKQKSIKYVYFTVVPYNNVGDIQSCRIGRHSSFTGKITGPINYDDSFIGSSAWENAWYNSTISCIKISKVKVIYMDGTSYTYVNELPKIMAKSFDNRCN